MKTLRLVIVARRFWPLVGGTPSAFAHLATALQERGARVTVLTARWQRDWPERIEHGGVRVERLPFEPHRRRAGLRFGYRVWRWLRAHAEEFDAAYVSGLREEACAAVMALGRSNCPVILRPEQTGLSGDCHWQLEAACGRRIKRRCGQAAALLASHSAAERELVAAGFPRNVIRRLPWGVPMPQPVAAAAKATARAVLAQANPALSAPPNARVVLSTGRLLASKGLSTLLDAWRTIAAARPEARLWIAGEGPEHAALSEAIVRRGLAASAILAGAFDPVDDLLAAADLYVCPAVEEGTTLGLMEALAARLPCVASDIPGHRDLIERDIHGWLVPSGDGATMAAAIEVALAQPDEAARRAAAGRERIAAGWTLDRMADAHVELFRSADDVSNPIRVMGSRYEPEA